MSTFSCRIQYKKVEGNSKLSTMNLLAAHGYMDRYGNILNVPRFYEANTELSNLASQKLGRPVRLFQVEDVVGMRAKKAFPVNALFEELDNLPRPNLEEYRQKLTKYPDDNRSDALPDSDLQQRLFNGKAVVSTRELLKNISHPVYGPIAKQLLQNITEETNIPIQLINSRGLDRQNSRGLFYPKNRGNFSKIEIAQYANYAKGSADGVILHEIMHALTYNTLTKDTELSRDWYALYEYAASVVKEKHYGLSNMEEFASELFTNAKFINTLTKYPPSQNNGKYLNLWQEVLDLLKSILGMSNVSLYDEATALLSNIVEQGAKTNRQMALENLALEELFLQYAQEESNEAPIFLTEGTEDMSCTI